MMCFASYRDTTTTTITPLRNALLTNGVTAVNIVGSPSASTQRVIDYLSVYNADTVGNEVTVRFYDGTTGYRLIVCRLGVGEKLEYAEGTGFRVISNGNSTKTFTTVDAVTTTSNFNMTVLGNDISITPPSANTIVEVSNLPLPVKAGKKTWFRYVLFYNANATTTGSRWDLYGTGATLYYQVRASLTSQSETYAGGLYTYNSNIPFSATSAATTGNATLIEGFVMADFDGFVIPIAGCEFQALGSSITVKAGSYLQYLQTA